MEWNWWGHGVGVGSWSGVDLQNREQVKMRKRKRVILGVGLAREAIFVAFASQKDAWYAWRLVILKSSVFGAKASDGSFEA